jgi:hypothetical protein
MATHLSGKVVIVTGASSGGACAGAIVSFAPRRYPVPWIGAGIEGLKALRFLPRGWVPWRSGLAELRLFSYFEKLHPQQPHWYMLVIGVDPAFQGKGKGAELFAPVLRREHPASLPATACASCSNTGTRCAARCAACRRVRNTPLVPWFRARAALPRISRESPETSKNCRLRSGGGEIRTRGPLRVAGFQDRWFEPLTHPSAAGAPEGALSRFPVRNTARTLPRWRRRGMPQSSL